MIDNSNVTMVNSILWNNGTSEFTSLPNNSLLNINALHSNIRLYEESIENVLFSSDPLFIDYENNNFNLYNNFSLGYNTNIDWFYSSSNFIELSSARLSCKSRKPPINGSSDIRFLRNEISALRALYPLK